MTLTLFGSIGLTRPVLATNPDFAVSANPSSVVIPLGYWAETMLTITSLNGFEGTIQLNAPVGGRTGLAGAGFSTGMTLNPDGSVNTDLQLTPGTTPGNYDLNVTATVGSVSHFLVIPVTVLPVSGPDDTGTAGQSRRLQRPSDSFSGRDTEHPERSRILFPAEHRRSLGRHPGRVHRLSFYDDVDTCWKLHRSNHSHERNDIPCLPSHHDGGRLPTTIGTAGTRKQHLDR